MLIERANRKPQTLQRLHRMKVVTESFIGEIQTRPDHRHTSNRFFWKHCPVLHVALRALLETRTNVILVQSPSRPLGAVRLL